MEENKLQVLLSLLEFDNCIIVEFTKKQVWMSLENMTKNNNIDVILLPSHWV